MRATSRRSTLSRVTAVVAVFGLTIAACSVSDDKSEHTKAEQLEQLIEDNRGEFSVPLSQRVCDMTPLPYFAQFGLKLTQTGQSKQVTLSHRETCMYDKIDVTYWQGPARTTVVYDDAISLGMGGGMLPLDVSKGSAFYGAAEGIRYTDGGKLLNTVLLRDPGSYADGRVVEIKARNDKDLKAAARAIIEAANSY